jgi:hypothetical protein
MMNRYNFLLPQLMAACFISMLLTANQGNAQNVETTYSTDTVQFVYDTIYLDALGKKFEINKNVTEYQSQADMGGNTSVRNVSHEELSWKSQGYFQRNRDLGQMFIPKKDTWVQSIVVRTGPAESAVLYDTPGSKVFMQFFEVFGEPVINDNGTPKGTQSTHGFNTNHRTDDFIEGVEYKSFPTIYRGVFPTGIPITKDKNGNALGDAGKLYYIRWSFQEPVLFKANHRYGFMMGFLETGLGLGFTLANANRAASSDVPSLDDRNTPYKGGWSFRREGDGTLPPTMFPGNNPPVSDSITESLKSESLFKPGFERYRLSPTSDGFPDVDTYRAFEFYVEEHSNTVELDGVELPIDSLTLNVGEQFALKPVFAPANASNKTATWFSAAPSVASVDNNGTVTAHKVGQTAITIFTQEGSFFDTAIVTVKDSLATAVQITGVPNNAVQVYPNPNSSGFLTVKSGNSTIKNINIYSANGGLMLSKYCNGTEFVINISGLQKAFYVVKVLTLSEALSFPLIIE